jgi:hypothetical protein
MTFRLSWGIAMLIVAMMSLAGACGGGSDGDVLKPADGVNETVRQVLQEGEPSSASGQLLQLTAITGNRAGRVGGDCVGRGPFLLAGKCWAYSSGFRNSLWPQ